MRASQDRRHVAALIGVISRDHGNDAPELAVLRDRLDELRAADLIAAGAAAQAALLTRAEAVNAGRQARRAVQAMTEGPAGGVA